MAIGSVPTMAHRGQLRIPRGGDSHERPNIRLVRRQPLLGAEDEEEFHGFTDDELRRNRKRKHPVESPTMDAMDLSEYLPRRSKRQKRANQRSDFVYPK